MSLYPPCQEVWEQAGRHANGTVAENYIKELAENGIPSVTTSSSKVTPPNLFQTIPPTGDQLFKHRRLWVPFSSKLPRTCKWLFHFNRINSANPWRWEVFVLLLHPQFLSSKFLPTCLLLPWVSLFLGLKRKNKLLWMGFLSWKIYYLSIGNLLIFTIWFCILQLPESSGYA